jgi:signal transduction histidine kinase
MLLLTLAVFLPAAGIIFVSGLERRNLEISMAENKALLLVQSLAAQQDQFAIGTRQMLSTLAQLPEVQRLDVDACNELFRELKNRNPFYSTIGAVTSEGNLITNAPPLETRSLNLLDRKHIKDAMATLDFSAGEYIVGRVTKVPSINYTYPILDPNKRLVGVLTAGFRLDQYARFIEKAGLPKDSAVAIADHRGVRLCRFPENEATAIGMRVSEFTFSSISGDREQGTYEKTSMDGIQRVYAFKQLRLREDFPPYLYVLVGIPKDRIAHQANMRTLKNLLELGLAAVLALSFSWFLGNATLVKPINKLVSATQRLGSGELGVRTGLSYTPDELGKLAKSFDDMASLLEKKNIDRKEVEDALRRSEGRLRDLSSKLLTAQEDERRRVSREVHDSIGSYLTGIKIRLESAVRAAGRGEALTEKLQVLVEMIQHVIRESRRIMTDLRPSVLDHHRIEVTISWLCERFEELYPAIRIEANTDFSENNISEQLKVVIFRIVQEALSNAARHSGSPVIAVSLRMTEAGVELQVRDEGAGFQVEEAIGKGLGLTSMLERVELTLGTFRIDSSPGQGTTIRAFWPVLD